MDAEEFFSRWSRRNAQAKLEQEDQAAADAAARAREDGVRALAPPTLDEAATLTPQSDFSRFVARGVDENVRRCALKKLFADPHFNVMDGLDIYIDDYNKFTPLPAAVLVALNHARDLLNPQALLDRPVPGKAEQNSEDRSLFAAPDTDHDGSAEADSDDSGGSDPDSPSSSAAPTDRPDHGNPIQDM